MNMEQAYRGNGRMTGGGRSCFRFLPPALPSTYADTTAPFAPLPLRPDLDLVDDRLHAVHFRSVVICFRAIGAAFDGASQGDDAFMDFTHVNDPSQSVGCDVLLHLGLDCFVVEWRRCHLV